MGVLLWELQNITIIKNLAVGRTTKEELKYFGGSNQRYHTG
jgi:hypothetical protein